MFIRLYSPKSRRDSLLTRGLVRVRCTPSCDPSRTSVNRESCTKYSPDHSPRFGGPNPCKLCHLSRVRPRAQSALGEPGGTMPCFALLALLALMTLVYFPGCLLPKLNLMMHAVESISSLTETPRRVSTSGSCTTSASAFLNLCFSTFFFAQRRTSG